MLEKGKYSLQGTDIYICASNMPVPPPNNPQLHLRHSFSMIQKNSVVKTNGMFRFFFKMHSCICANKKRRMGPSLVSPYVRSLQPSKPNTKGWFPRTRESGFFNFIPKYLRLSPTVSPTDSITPLLRGSFPAFTFLFFVPTKVIPCCWLIRKSTLALGVRSHLFFEFHHLYEKFRNLHF